MIIPIKIIQITKLTDQPCRPLFYHKNNLMREDRERKGHVMIDAIEMHKESRLSICGTSPWNWISHAKGHGYFDVHLNNPKPVSVMLC